jgi:hypothetical protein
MFDFSRPLAPWFTDLALLLAFTLTLAGSGLHLYQSRYRMSVEERVKDSALTETEARRQLRVYQLFAPVTTVVGVLLLVLAACDLVR